MCINQLTETSTIFLHLFFKQAGITTEEINTLVHTKCVEAGAYPSPLKYKGYPKSVCTSVNNVACHGIPGPLMLKDGDIINVDITVCLISSS